MRRALSLAIFVGELFDLGWRGIVAKLVGVWSEYVRPVTQWITEILITPLEWVLGQQLEVPLLARDYWSVGVVLLLSFVRVETGDSDGFRDWFGDELLELKRSPLTYIVQLPLRLGIFTIMTLAWPLMTIGMIAVSVIAVYLRAAQGERQFMPDVKEYSLILLPLFYLLIIFCVDFVQRRLS